jgi:hypothetical protein
MATIGLAFISWFKELLDVDLERSGTPSVNFTNILRAAFFA